MLNEKCSFFLLETLTQGCVLSWENSGLSYGLFLSHQLRLFKYWFLSYFVLIYGLTH